MESTGDILAKMGLRTSSSAANTDTSSATEAGQQEETAAGPAVCPICRGVGYVRREVPIDHPDFGRAIPCRCKQRELAERQVEKLLEASNLGPLQRLTFDTLLEQGRSSDPRKQEQFRRAYATARAFAEQPDGWLVLMGVSGCGKTHLAAAIANHQIRQGNRAFFAIVPDLLDHLRYTYQPDSPVAYDELFEAVRNAPLLILDDLGTQHNTPWAQEKLFQLLNHRYNSQLPTVVTTNCALDELNERIRTRLTDTVLCQVCEVEPRESDILHKLGNLEMLAHMTFATFDLKRDKLTLEERETLKQVYDAARTFAEEPDGWHILQGHVGCGKTHLAAAIANECRSRGEPVFFVVVPDLLDYLRSTYQPDSRITYDQVFEALRSAPILILDDLGAQASTPWAREKLFQLINHRYVGRLATVITMNCSLDELEPRLASRMADPRVSSNFWITAPDYRAQGKPTDLHRRAEGKRPRGTGRASPR